MKKIAALLISIILIHPQEALMPLALAAESSASPDASAAVSSLEGIDVAQDAINIHLSAPARYRAFVTATPPRLVLELSNTEIDLAQKSLAGQGKYLKRIRAAQFVGKPNPKTRVVLDLTQSVPYDASFHGNALRIFLGDDATVHAPTPKTTPVDPPDDPPLPEASVGAPKPDPKKPAAEPRPMSTQISSDLSEMVAQNSVVSSRAPSAAAASAAAGQPAAGASFPRQRDILATLPHDVISLDFDNTDVGDILKLMAAKAGLNIVYGADVTGPLSLHLVDVPFNEAFNIVMSMKGLVATQPGNNILRVMTPTTLTSERTNTIGITRVFQINYKKASEMKTEIDSVRSAEKRTGASVSDDMNNQLIVTETPEGIASVERLLAQIDVRPRQVLIESKLVEVQLSNDLEFGIQWDYLGIDRGRVGGKQGVSTIGTPIFENNTPVVTPMDNSQLAITGGASGIPGIGAAGRGTGVSLPADKVFGAFTLGRITNNYMLSATLTAAASAGKAKVLSDPKIATLNGKQAMINITTQIPYVTSNVASTGVQTQSVAYTTTGIQLTVTPTITADGRINLKVTPNVSKPSATAATAGNTGAVAVDTRQADTTVLVRDGETIVIGGLITDSLNDVVAKVPFLGDLPLIGWLFKKKTTQRSRVELLVFVTTKIMPD